MGAVSGAVQLRGVGGASIAPRMGTSAAVNCGSRARRGAAPLGPPAVGGGGGAPASRAGVGPGPSAGVEAPAPPPAPPLIGDGPAAESGIPATASSGPAPGAAALQAVTAAVRNRAALRVLLMGPFLAYLASGGGKQGSL